MLAGAIVSTLPLTPPVSLPGESPSLPSMLFGSLVLVVGLVPIASGLGGRFVTRWLALCLMLFVATGVNTVIELIIFGTEGGHRYLLVFYFLCFVATAAALAWQYSSHQSAPQLPHLGTGQWLWRVAVAWLRVPPLDVIMRTQLLRSFLFLASSLPVILLWTGSRRRLILVLGWAHTAMVGLYGLSQASFMPPALRVLHSFEIAADSFVYALVLVWLFFPRERVGAVSAVRGTTVSSTPSAA